MPPHTRTANPGADPSPHPASPVAPYQPGITSSPPPPEFFQQRVRAAVALGTRFVANATVLSAAADDVGIKIAIHPIG